jgi:hypothetical protein
MKMNKKRRKIRGKKRNIRIGLTEENGKKMRKEEAAIREGGE